ncbi:MAG: polyamine aminopropyltransferase [Peptococcaceae bacterium]|nr:polyamine aminopropyltransferase [Peptococcaceae bacterium]
MELWYSEKHSDDLKLSMRIKESLHTEKTPFQELAVLDTVPYGRMLVLDGLVMTTEKDEFIYHEMITHVPLCAHPCPEKVLIIGGGDGGTVREVLKHDTVQQVVLVEIDERVIEAARRFLPAISCALADDRVSIRVEDGICFVREHVNEFDVVIVDSTDPIGPAEGLFNREFYQNVFHTLRAGGLMVAQSESPFMNAEFIRRMRGDVGSVFPICKLYMAHIPTYPSGAWCFICGSKEVDPEEGRTERLQGQMVKYYTPALQKAAFQLPAFVVEIMKK